MKMTALPVATIGAVDRGMLAPGMVADVVVFDPATIIDRSDYMNPTTPSEGVVHVLVGGRWALRAGAVTGERAGRALTRGEHEPARPSSLRGSRAVRGELTSSGEFLLPGISAVRIDAQQGANERLATGSVDFLDDQGGVVRVADRLGVLQVAEGWATLGVVVRNEDGTAVPASLTIDLRAPSASQDVTVVTLNTPAGDARAVNTTGSVTISRAR